MRRRPPTPYPRASFPPGAGRPPLLHSRSRFRSHLLPPLRGPQQIRGGRGGGGGRAPHPQTQREIEGEGEAEESAPPPTLTTLTHPTPPHHHPPDPPVRSGPTRSTHKIQTGGSPPVARGGESVPHGEQAGGKIIIFRCLVPPGPHHRHLPVAGQEVPPHHHL